MQRELKFFLSTLIICIFSFILLIICFNILHKNKSFNHSYYQAYKVQCSELINKKYDNKKIQNDVYVNEMNICLEDKGYYKIKKDTSFARKSLDVLRLVFLISLSISICLLIYNFYIFSIKFIKSKNTYKTERFGFICIFIFMIPLLLSFILYISEPYTEIVDLFMSGESYCLLFWFGFLGEAVSGILLSGIFQKAWDWFKLGK